MARGCCATEHNCFELSDLPGTNSLRLRSPEEETARAFLTDCHPDAAVVVCDATCLKRNLNLALQVMELCPQNLICVNLLDEARRKGVMVDLKLLSRKLGVPVIGTSVRDRTSPLRLLTALDDLLEGRSPCEPRPVPYPTRRPMIRTVMHRFAGWLGFRMTLHLGICGLYLLRFLAAEMFSRLYSVRRNPLELLQVQE